MDSECLSLPMCLDIFVLKKFKKTEKSGGWDKEAGLGSSPSGGGGFQAGFYRRKSERGGRVWGKGSGGTCTCAVLQNLGRRCPGRGWFLSLWSWVGTELGVEMGAGEGGVQSVMPHADTARSKQYESPAQSRRAISYSSTT